MSASRYMLARIGTISRKRIGALKRRTTRVRQNESIIQKTAEKGRNTATNFSTGACSSAAPTFPIGMRQKISAKIATVPTYGRIFFKIGVARADAAGAEAC